MRRPGRPFGYWQSLDAVQPSDVWDTARRRSLAVERPPSPSRRAVDRRRWVYPVTLASGAAVVALLARLVVTASTGPVLTGVPSSIAVLERIDLPGHPIAEQLSLAADGDLVWLGDESVGELVAWRVAGGESHSVVEVSVAVVDVAAVGESAIVVDADGVISEVNASGEVIEIARPERGSIVPGTELVADERHIAVSGWGGYDVVLVDRRSGELTQLELDDVPDAVALGNDRLWLVEADRRTLRIFDATGPDLLASLVLPAVDGLAAVGDSAWVSSRASGQLIQLTSSLDIEASTALSDPPSALVVGAGVVAGRGIGLTLVSANDEAVATLAIAPTDPLAPLAGSADHLWSWSSSTESLVRLGER